MDKVTNVAKYKKGTFGWLKEEAKKDGFDNIRGWQIWKMEQANKYIKRNKKSWTKNEIANLITRFYEKTEFLQLQILITTLNVLVHK